MRTRVDFSVTIQSWDEDDYCTITDFVEAAIAAVSGVESVELGVGEELDED